MKISTNIWNSKRFHHKSCVGKCLIGMLLLVINICDSAYGRNYVAYKMTTKSLYSEKKCFTKDCSNGLNNGEIVKNDSLITYFPRKFILENFNCSSLADSRPICSTFVDYGDSIINLKLHFGILESKFYQNEKNDISDQELRKYFEKNIMNIKSITTKKYEENDRGWAFFDGFYVALPTFIGSALLELLWSKSSNEKYDWRIPGYLSGGTFIGFSGYRYLTMETNPRGKIYNIQIINEF